MRWRNLIVALLLQAALPAPAPAAVIPIARLTTDSIAFENAADFTGARTHATDRTTYTGNAGESTSAAFLFLSPSFNVTVTGDPHMAVSDLVADAFGASFVVTSVDGAPGTVTLALDRFANVGTTLVTGVLAGRNTLTVSRNPSGGVADGSPFYLLVTLPGDWSAAGAVAGGHELVSFNPLWTIDENFVFDGLLTNFRAHIDAYVNDAASSQAPNLRFRLYGAAVVPASGTAILLALGLATLAAGRSGGSRGAAPRRVRTPRTAPATARRAVGPGRAPRPR